MQETGQSSGDEEAMGGASRYVHRSTVVLLKNALVSVLKVSKFIFKTLYDLCQESLITLDGFGGLG